MDKIKKLAIGASATAILFGSLAGGAFAKNENKVDVCHREGNGSYHLINVSTKALPAHQAHGDGLPGGVLQDQSGIFSENCDVVTELSFTADDSLYYNGIDSSFPLYGTGAISFTWDPVTGTVTGGNYDEVVPPTTGTVYYNVVTSGTVVGNNVSLTFNRTVPNVYGPFTFSGTLTGNVLSGFLDGPYYFAATGN